MAGFFYSRFGSFGLYLLLPILLFIGTTTSASALTLSNYTESYNGNNSWTVGFDVSGGVLQSYIAFQQSAGVSVIASCSGSTIGLPGLPNAYCYQNFVGDGHYDFTFTISADMYGTTGTSLSSDVSDDTAWNSSLDWDGADFVDFFPSVCSSGELCFAYVTPSPGGGNGVQALLTSATSSFALVTGIEFDDILTWTSNNLIKLFIGSGFALLYTLRFWIVAFIVFASIVYFAFRGLGFFKH